MSKCITNPPTVYPTIHPRQEGLLEKYSMCCKWLDQVSQLMRDGDPAEGGSLFDADLLQDVEQLERQFYNQAVGAAKILGKTFEMVDLPLEEIGPHDPLFDYVYRDFG